MNVRTTEFRVQEGQKVDLHKWPTAVEPIYESKKQYQKLLKKHVEELSSLQQLLYASNRYAVLLIFQAMDAAGKDGAIRHVMSGVNPQGCQEFSYRHPSATELEGRRFWTRYVWVFGEALSATSTREAPWYVVPADDKENARLIVSQIILDNLNGLEMTYPEVSAQRQQELQSIRERLINRALDRNYRV